MMSKATSVADKAFKGCIGLMSPTRRGDQDWRNAFEGCKSLRSTTVSSQDIGEKAYKGCKSLLQFDAPKA